MGRSVGFGVWVGRLVGSSVGLLVLGVVGRRVGFSVRGRAMSVVKHLPNPLQYPEKPVWWSVQDLKTGACSW